MVDRWASVLTRKLVRDLMHIWAQAVAIALVIGCGVAMFVMSLGMMRSLEVTRDAYYERYRFADVFVPAVRAPEGMLERIREINGVRTADGRISAQLILDVPGIDEPINGRVHSLPRNTGDLNSIALQRGRLPGAESDDEVVVSEQFASAHGFALGDGIGAIMNGKRRALTIVGTALSPEYVYAIAPGQLIPDNLRFGVLWMRHRPLAAAFDLEDAYNEFLVDLSRDANGQEVIDRLDELLDPYGAIGSYLRKEQVSERFVANEMDQLRTITGIIPPIFLGVAAFLLNIVVGRLIRTEREEIGLMKAFGYTNRDVAAHYLKFVMVIVGLGIAAGFGFGAWLGRGLALLYTDFFTFPFLLFRAGLDVYALAGAVTIGAALLATLHAVLAAAQLPPAEAMRPPAPPDYSRSLFRRFERLPLIGEPTRMIIRHLGRHAGRALVTTGGVMLALAVLIMSSFSRDSVNRLVELVFDYSQRQDLAVTFYEPRSNAALYALRRYPGVIAVEPIRGVAAVLTFGSRSERQGLTGLPAAASLNRLIDEDTRPVSLPPEGLMLSRPLANKLGASRGDRLILDIREGRRPRREVVVAGIVDTYVGSPAYMEIGALNKLMQEGAVVSGANLLIDRQRLGDLHRELKDTPLIAGVMLRQAAIDTLDETMSENMLIITFINMAFASLIVIGVVYNTARIALAERSRELASLRVLGFNRSEVAYILLGELFILVGLALPFGAVLGAGMAYGLTLAFNSDLFTIPYALERTTVAYSIAVVCAAAIASALVVRRNLDRLDLIGVLKTRD